MTETVSEQPVSLLKRLCLRLDNGTRIGCSSLLGAEGTQIVKLDFAEGFKKGFVSDDDLRRISEIAGQLDAQRGAPALNTKPHAQTTAAKDAKRKRVQKPATEIPDAWTQKGMRVLDAVGSQQHADWFSKPVEPTTTYVPDYFNVVKSPMDLGTIRERLRSGYYASPVEFQADLALIWHNAILYNGKVHSVGKVAAHLSTVATKEMNRCGLSGGGGEMRGKRASAVAASGKWDAEPEMSTDSKRARPARQPSAAPAPSSRPAPRQTASSSRGAMSFEQRNTLGSRLEAVVSDPDQEAVMTDIIAVLPSGPDDEELELDMNELPNDVCWKVQDILDAAAAAAGTVHRGPQVTAGVDLDDEETDVDG